MPNPSGDGATRLDVDDRRLLSIIDTTTQTAIAAAGAHVTCHRGCSPCCFGPFAITQLDARRLQVGLQNLASRNRDQAAQVAQRAQWAISEQTSHFPTDRVGILDTPQAEDELYQAFAATPCPALDPDTGACLIYMDRPVACRMHGPPIRISGDDFAPCPLCFKTATPAEIEAARVIVDVDEIEQPLVQIATAEAGCLPGMTTVAFALASVRP